MIILHTVAELQKVISAFKNDKKSVGFVPTMGALHDGHISLVKECKKDNDISVVSVFVNPTQFNNKEDLEKYPRDIEKDATLLEKNGVDIVFAPSVDEMYPEPDTRIFDFGQLDKVMEGKFRPGHFNGVAQVVSRLFNMVHPDKAYFGEKDFQQLAIIRDMVKQYQIPVQIIGMPIKRGESGLAMSSRNERLSEAQRIEAANIYRILSDSKTLIAEKSVQETHDLVVNEINRIESLEVEYFDIVDGNTLQSILNWSDTNYAVGCIAVFCGEVRLIDNITYFDKQK